MTFPAIFLPFVYSFFFIKGNPATTEAPMALAAHLAPLAMGLWNVFAVKVRSHIKFKDTRFLCTASGFTLGIVAGVIATFCYPVFEILFGFEGILKYSALIFYPIFFSLVFRFVVHPLNKDFGVY